ncbi:LOW QUALITY PROTEIN: relaxin receptor 2 [Porphyrio hochstetteri]
MVQMKRTVPSYLTCTGFLQHICIQTASRKAAFGLWKLQKLLLPIKVKHFYYVYLGLKSILDYKPIVKIPEWLFTGPKSLFFQSMINNSLETLPKKICTQMPINWINKELHLQRLQFHFFIVFTDAICWLPVSAVESLLFQVEILDIIPSLIVIFLLPIPSALNPVLHSLSATFFKEKLKQSLDSHQRKEILKNDTLACSVMRTDDLLTHGSSFILGLLKK